MTPSRRRQAGAACIYVSRAAEANRSMARHDRQKKGSQFWLLVLGGAKLLRRCRVRFLRTGPTITRARVEHVSGEELSERSRLRKTATKAAEFGSTNQSTLT